MKHFEVSNLVATDIPEGKVFTVEKIGDMTIDKFQKSE